MQHRLEKRFPDGSDVRLRSIPERLKVRVAFALQRAAPLHPFESPPRWSAGKATQGTSGQPRDRLSPDFVFHRFFRVVTHQIRKAVQL